jgi:hypothetical protein
MRHTAKASASVSHTCRLLVQGLRGTGAGLPGAGEAAVCVHLRTQFFFVRVQSRPTFNPFPCCLARATRRSLEDMRRRRRKQKQPGFNTLAASAMQARRPPEETSGHRVGL